MTDKQQLRKHIKSLKQHFLHAHTVEQQHALSEALLAKVESMPAFKNAQTVLAYYSLPDEVYTHSFVRRWAKHKTLLLPKVMGDDLTIHRYNGESSLSVGAYGIKEPVTPCFSACEKIDFVIVPGVAFDRSGNRLGRGRGYYDKLLSNLLPFDVLRVGICYPFQLVEQIPTDPTDISMNQIVCEL